MADINSYIVDEGGYVVSTLDRAKALVESLQSIVTRLDSGDLETALANFFGGQTNVQQDRLNIALSLDRVVSSAQKLAVILRADKVDERESDMVGYDADHSIG